MNLPQQKIEELKKVIAYNYDVLLSEEELNELGETLLRITRVAILSMTQKGLDKNREEQDTKHNKQEVSQ